MRETVDMPAPHFYEKVLRIVLQATLGRLPDRLQYSAFRALKVCRRLVAPSRRDVFASWNHLAQDAVVGPAGAAAGTFSVTHDVDYGLGLDFLPQLLRTDRELGVRATYFLLTREPYRLDDATLSAIRDGGHEIALHGDHHDRALAFRSESRVRAFLSSAKAALERGGDEVLGFRAPALSVGPRVLSALDAEGFVYDSSFCSSSLASSFTPFARPFQVPDSRLTEIPLTIQDSMFTNDVPLPPDRVEEGFARLAGLFEQRGFALVANFHPVIIRRDVDLYVRAVRAMMGSHLTNRVLKDLAAKDH